MRPTQTTTAAAAAAYPPQFELSADHLAVLAQLPIAEAWRFCVRKRRDLVTPDFATFVQAVAWMGVPALADLRAAAGHAGADVGAWRGRAASS